MTHLAEAILRAILHKFASADLSLIAMGKLGGHEMTFGSDLDIVFVSETEKAMTAAEKIMKTPFSH